MNLGEKIKDYRLGKRMTQEKLAKVLGVRKSSVHNWETHKSQPQSSKVREKLGELLGIDLLDEEEGKERWWRKEKQRRKEREERGKKLEAIKGDRIYFTGEVKEMLEALKEQLEDEEDPHDILEGVLEELNHCFPEYITRDPDEKGKIIFQPWWYKERKDWEGKIYRAFPSLVVELMGDVYGWRSDEEAGDWNSPLNQVLLRLVKIFPEYLEKEDTEGKITIRLKR